MPKLNSYLGQKVALYFAGDYLYDVQPISNGYGYITGIESSSLKNQYYRLLRKKY